MINGTCDTEVTTGKYASSGQTPHDETTGRVAPNTFFTDQGSYENFFKERQHSNSLVCDIMLINDGDNMRIG